MFKFIVLIILNIYFTNVAESQTCSNANNCDLSYYENEMMRTFVTNHISLTGVAPKIVYKYSMKAWEAYKKQFQKVYTAEEDVYAHRRFRVNINRINDHNMKYMNRSLTYMLAPNEFTDQSPKILKKTFSTASGLTLNFTQHKSIPLTEPPKQFDYRKEFFLEVSVMKKTSGSGWREAFKTIFTMMSSIKFRNRFNAIHQLINDIDQTSDCQQVKTSYECLKKYMQINQNETFMYSYMDYKDTNAGICLPSDKLHYDNVTADLSDDRLRKVVAYMSPVVVPYSPVSFELLHYSQGLFTPPEISITKSYFMVVIGYGTENGTDYWILQNSFGPDWGEHGYIRVKRSSQKLCPHLQFMF